MTDSDPVDFPITIPRGILSGKKLPFVTIKGTKLGSGTTGALYGYHVPHIYPSVQKVAVKFTRNDDRHYKDKRVQRQLDPTEIFEASILTSLSHPNLPPLIDMFVYDKGMGIVLPWYYGSLGKLLSDNKRKVDHSILLPIIFDIIKGVRHLHHNHWIHADLKPDNILLDIDTDVKSNRMYKGIVGDFGFARQSKECLFEEWSRPEGYTPKYASPEVLIKLSQDKPADIWSIGCIIFELYYRGYLFSPPYPKDPEIKNKMDKKNNHKEGIKLRKYVQLVDVYNALGLPETNWFDGTLAERYKESIEIYYLYKNASFEYKDRDNDFNGESMEERYDALKKQLKKNNVPNKNDLIDIIKRCIVMDPKKRADIDELYLHPLFKDLRKQNKDNTDNEVESSCLEFSLVNASTSEKYDDNDNISTSVFTQRAISKLGHYNSEKISDTFSDYTFADLLVSPTSSSKLINKYSNNLDLAHNVTDALRYRTYCTNPNIQNLEPLLRITKVKLYATNSLDILRYILNNETVPDMNLFLLLLLHISSVTLKFDSTYIATTAWIINSKNRKTDRKNELYRILGENDILEHVESILTALIDEYNRNKFTPKINEGFKDITGRSVKEFLEELELIGNDDEEDSDSNSDSGEIIVEEELNDEQEEGDQLSEGGNEASDDD